MATFAHNPPTASELAETDPEPSIDPALYTPSFVYKEDNIVISNCCTSHRGSDGSTRAKQQLVSTVKDVAENLGHAFQKVQAMGAVVEGTQAQLVVQNLVLKKQQASLFEKEKAMEDVEESTRIVPLHRKGRQGRQGRKQQGNLLCSTKRRERMT